LEGRRYTIHTEKTTGHLYIRIMALQLSVEPLRDKLIESGIYDIGEKAGFVYVHMELAKFEHPHFYATGGAKYENDPETSRRLGIRLYLDKFSEWLRFVPASRNPSGIPSAMSLIEWLEDRIQEPVPRDTRRQILPSSKMGPLYTTEQKQQRKKIDSQKYKLAHKKEIAEYYLDNRDQILGKMALYYEANAQTIEANVSA
jgi:hypothetical protein